ncbi:YceD family protein [Mesoplasma lactucae]|uniref:Uncharacterized protein n=1 Tax=Mesoplasma lactucae ATCC 49193 TaxID=81460 RepID=A0A291IRW1_9MOLU|nr:DUF177 domain-containing protein [Mesoplasma lactucae]ATG97490.1 hypothetical protein CP520_01830 [Mesoplasma lactucae ATCC 49193]ATZ20055.1 hypothetical protein MLACT_v1c02340 [Mesoplasma lactucae ATCC 49193]MCL8216803.1 hypothetical protein [Mesoplasma lactucae ATCC 49193]
MLKQEIRKHGKEPFEVSNELTKFDGFEIHSPLIKKYNTVSYDAEVFYDKNEDEIIVHGTINYSLDAIDARDGELIVHEEEIPWDDAYSFVNKNNDDVNIIDGENVDFDTLVIEQINANIPMNLTHNHDIISKAGSGWSLMSEEEYEANKNNQPDPRWDKLKEFKFKDDKNKN